MVGNVSSVEAWAALERDERAQLVDVRTAAEWSYVGLPDLDAVGKRVILIAWQEFPSGERNPQFLRELSDAKLSPDGDVYFLCRSGSRSMAAARAAAEAGYQKVWNVVDGFEGSRDASQHRGTIDGWKASGLPWRQS